MFVFLFENGAGKGFFFSKKKKKEFHLILGMQRSVGDS